MKLKLSFVAAATAVVLTGCMSPDGTPNNTGTGALTGGAIGAFTGAVLGGHNAGAGALIGGAVGAVAGGLIGHSIDQDQRERLRAMAPVTYARVDQGQPLMPADIKALVRAGVHDDVIITQIQSSHSVFRLTTDEIIDLKDAGVSERLLQFMINTPTTIGEAAPAAPVVADAPPPPPTETVAVAPGPGYVWVDGEWEWNGRWVWVGGHWILPPRPGVVWVRGYWRSGPYGWYSVGGHWR